MNKCKICGGEYTPGETICPYCGHSLLDNEKDNSDKYSNPPVKAENISVLKYSEFMDAEILYKLGLCKLNGIGTEKNEKEAFEAFRKLSARGHFDSMYQLAEMYLAQDPPNNEEAYMWLKIAAESGHLQSKIKLKTMGEDISIFQKPHFFEESGGADEFTSLVKMAMPGIVMVYSAPLSGAGFVLEGGFVITNAHVIGKRKNDIKARFESTLDSGMYDLALLSVRPEYDVAVLKFSNMENEKLKEHSILKLKTERPAYGEMVYTIGNPLGLTFSVSKGVVSCPNRIRTYPSGVGSVIQVDITANHGNSGGALLDASNNVVGMVTFIDGQSKGGISHCIPSKYIVEVLNSLN